MFGTRPLEYRLQWVQQQRLNSTCLSCRRLLYRWFPPRWPPPLKATFPSTQRRTSSRGFDFLIGLDVASESGRRRHLRRSSDWRHCSLADSVLGRDCETRIHRPGADCLIFYLLCKEFSFVTSPHLVWWQKRERKEKWSLSINNFLLFLFVLFPRNGEKSNWNGIDFVFLLVIRERFQLE